MIAATNKWKALLELCWLLGHEEQQIVDHDARRVFGRCLKCGREAQSSFQASLHADWIGFCDEAHRCPLCSGWKPRGWNRCAGKVCLLNPEGVTRLEEESAFPGAMP